jgi:RecB family exonuclease
VISPRRTRLHRAADADGFRGAIAALVDASQPAAAADVVVVVPTRAAGAMLRETLESRLLSDARPVLRVPALVTRGDLIAALRARLVAPPPLLSPFEREVILARAAAAAQAAGFAPPFSVRPGLVAEMLALYDALRRQLRTVDRFAEFLDDELSHADDRGATRLLAQTRFLADAFRRYEARLDEIDGDDEHRLRDRLLAEPAPRPIRQAIVTVSDRVADPAGLWPADLDLLARLPGLEQIDVVATEARLAGGWLERLFAELPGIEERPAAPPRGERAVCLVPSPDAWLFTSRDREEELAGVARRLKAERRAGRLTASTRVALVVRRPLPYLYLARDVLGRAGIAYEARDALPLAAEPFAAALDLVLEWLASGFTRPTTLALLRSPHLLFADPERGEPAAGGALVALDRALAEARYLGEATRLAALTRAWAALPDRRRHAHARRALPAARTAAAAAGEAAPLTETQPAASLLGGLVAFVERHLRPLDAADPLAEREARVRAAVLDTCRALAGAYARHDPEATVELAAIVPAIRRWLGAQTFAPRGGAGGVQIVDAATAPYGEFDEVQIVGLIDADWPERERRSIFYPAFLLQALGWPEERARLAGARAAFVELLGVPSRRLALSTITLEDDAIVEPSAFVHEVAVLAPPRQVVAGDGGARVFPWEGLALEPLALDAVPEPARSWAAFRASRSAATDGAYHGEAGPWVLPRLSVSRLERYLDCPFRFYAAEVLGLQEAPDEDDSRTPLERGLFLHELFERVFAAWQAAGRGAITPATLDEAHLLFAEVAEAALATLPPGEAAIERLRLFGAAGAPGIARRVLALEAERGGEVVERLLEYPLEGAFTFRAPDGRARTLTLRGKVDRIDLLDDGTFHLIDYKTRAVPDPKRALQLPIYAVCVGQRLAGHRGRSWRLGEASYLSYEGTASLVPLTRRPDEREARVGEAQRQLFDALDGIAAGHFPPQPAERSLCATCAFAAVCRKDYVEASAG